MTTEKKSTWLQYCWDNKFIQFFIIGLTGLALSINNASYLIEQGGLLATCVVWFIFGAMTLICLIGGMILNWRDYNAK